MPPFADAARDPLVQAYLVLSTPHVSDALDRLRLNGAPRGVLHLWPGCKKLVG
jgi:hypothetical protein